jgi:hypothetical protein
MSLRSELIAAVQGGVLPKVFTCQQVKEFFGRRYSRNYLNCALSNSEVLTSDHSPTYKKFTIRRDVGTYEIHPSLLLA